MKYWWSVPLTGQNNCKSCLIYIFCTRKISCSLFFFIDNLSLKRNLALFYMHANYLKWLRIQWWILYFTQDLYCSILDWYFPYCYKQKLLAFICVFSGFLLIQGVQEKLCFFIIHCNPSLAGIAVRDLQISASVQSLLLDVNFLYSQ